jgi:SAM-dependent methyltransferase
MVVQEDLHLCYPEEYSPYNLKREIPDIDFDNLPNGSFRKGLRKAIIDHIKGRPTGGFTGSIGRFLAMSAFMRERAFFGLLIDECLPKGKGEHFALDLGCGSGWLMEKLKKVGWETEGLEWNEKAAQLARDVTGCNVWAGDFRSIELPKGKYQLIVLNHVFEHFSDPKNVLLRLRELLADGGKAVLFYPNPHSVGSKWHNTDWFPWEVPRHLIFPTPEAVKLLAKQAGFSEARVKTRAHYSLVHWTWSKAYKQGEHPELYKGELNPAEKLAMIGEIVLAKLGFDKGWEIIATLAK